MVEVRFACIPSVAGVRCTINGVTKISSEIGIASFYGLSQGVHSYSVEAPQGMMFISGEDYFKRPLNKSGTTIIEWVPNPDTPWPEDQPWMMMFTFKEGITPPSPPKSMIEKIVAAVFIGGILVLFGISK